MTSSNGRSVKATMPSLTSNAPIADSNRSQRAAAVIGLSARCDEVWMVTCREPEQRSRLALRGMPPEEAARRIASHGADLVQRLEQHATRWIGTDGTLDETRERVEDALADALTPLLLGEGRE